MTRQLAFSSALLFAHAALAGPRGKPPAHPKEPPPEEAAPKEAPPPPPAPEPPPRPMPKPGDKRRIIAVLDVRVGEGVPPEVSQQFQRDLDQMVDPEHYWLAPRTRVHELMAQSTKWTDGCIVGPCISEVRTQTGADVALIAALTGTGTSFGSVITLVRTDNGAVLSQEAASCDVCTLNEALATAERASIKLLDALPAKLADSRSEQRSVIAPLQARITDLEHQREHHVAGYVLFALGLAAAGAGLAIYEAESQPSYSLGILGAGAGLVLGGVVVLTF